MTPPSPPKEDSSWLQLKEYEVLLMLMIIIKQNKEICFFVQITLQNLDTHLHSKIEIRNELERIRKEVEI